MQISVAICTWNRATLLDQTLAEMRKLEIPQDIEWELLVVNNNCTDSTDSVIERYSRFLPLRRLFQPSPGLSNARNCAVVAANGELLIWTDDDVLVAPRWLAEYAKAAQEWPEAIFFGGPVEPWFEGEPPSWLQSVWPRVSGAYAVIDFGKEPIPLDYLHIPFGANFAVRTEQQKKRRYDHRLGVAPGKRMGGEETDVIWQMLDDGIKGRWVPTASVRHFIPSARQTLGYLQTYYRATGEYWHYNKKEPDCPMLFGRPRWAWRGAVQSEIRYLVRRLFSTPEVWIEDFISATVCWGILWKPRP